MILDKKVIIFDTNVYLNLYRFSINYSSYILDVMDKIKDKIVVPSMIYHEFEKHSNNLYFSCKNFLDNLLDDSKRLVENQKKSIINNMKRLSQGQYPDENSFFDEIEKKYNIIKACIEDYSDSHPILDVISNYWNSNKPYEFMNSLKDNNRVLNDLSMNQLLKLTDEAEKRFKKNTPPGYKDAKNKTGISKYSDFIWWYEAIEYCKNNGLSLILVTDDMKSDWWKEDESDIREELKKEFEDKTKSCEKLKDVKLTIEAYSSKCFFENYAKDNNITIPDAIDFFTNMTDEEYVESIKEKAFEEVAYDLVYSGDEYLDISSFDHIGDEEIESWEIEESEFVDFTTERDGNYIYYYLNYNVIMRTESYDYNGRDDDTKEVILSNSYEHEVEGIVKIKVTRKIDRSVDLYDYEESDIFQANFEQLSFKDNNIDDYYDGNTCPICGCELTFDNDAGNGFCIVCSRNEDFDK